MTMIKVMWSALTTTLTKRELWLWCMHTPLDDIVMDILHAMVMPLRYGIIDITQEKHHQIERLILSIASRSSYARSFMTEVASRVVGVPVGDIPFDNQRLLQWLPIGWFYECEDTDDDPLQNFALLLLSLCERNEYIALTRKYTDPMFREAEIETRELLTTAMSICTSYDYDPVSQNVSLSCVLACIPSSTLIVDHTMLSVLLNINDRGGVAIPIVCKSWRDVWIDPRVINAESRDGENECP